MAITEKQLLRKAVRAQRQGLDAIARQDAAQALCSNLTRATWYRRSRRIAAYIAVRGEIDLAPFIQRAIEDGKRVFLPRLLPMRGRPMGFAEYDLHHSLRVNRFGIPEPSRRAALVHVRTLDVILAPLVAFDEQGNRLGMGGGFYDRALRRRDQRPRIIGVAYDFQRVHKLPTDTWDIPLHAVYTDSLVFDFQPGAA